MNGCDCEDCDIQCEFQARGIYCLTFKELCGDASYSQMNYGDDSKKGKEFRPIVKHVCGDELQYKWNKLQIKRQLSLYYTLQYLL